MRINIRKIDKKILDASGADILVSFLVYFIFLTVKEKK